VLLMFLRAPRGRHADARGTDGDMSPATRT